MSVISKLVEKRIQLEKKINSQKKARKGKKKKGIKQPRLSESTKRVQI